MRAGLWLSVVLFLALPGVADAAVTINSGPPARTNATTATFTFSSDTAGRGFVCSLDGAPAQSCTSPKTYSGLGDGAHEFVVTEVNFQSQPPSARRSWTVDLVAPETVLDAGPPAVTPQTDATFRFSSPDPGATFVCALDGETLSPCTSPVTRTGLADGQHSFRIAARDDVGNQDASPAVSSWRVDRTAPSPTPTPSPTAAADQPPDTFITSPLPVRVNAATPALTVASSKPGSTFTCALGADPPGPCPGVLSFAGRPEGPLTLSVQATDGAGMSDPTPATHTFVVDRTAPGAPQLRIAPEEFSGSLAIPRFVLGASQVLEWRAPEPLRYTIFQRALGVIVPKAIRTGVPPGTLPVEFEPGETKCFGGVAADEAGNLSPTDLFFKVVQSKFTSMRGPDEMGCAQRPFSVADLDVVRGKRSDDPELGRALAGPFRARLSLSRFTAAQRAGGVRQLALVARTCSACGTVTVRLLDGEGRGDKLVPGSALLTRKVKLNTRKAVGQALKSIVLDTRADPSFIEVSTADSGVRLGGVGVAFGS